MEVTLKIHWEVLEASGWAPQPRFQGSLSPEGYEGKFQTLSDSMDCSPPGSSVHGILQARILDGGCHFLLRRPSWPRDGTRVSSVSSQILYHWATWQSPALEASVESFSYWDPGAKRHSQGCERLPERSLPLLVFKEIYSASHHHPGEAGSKSFLEHWTRSPNRDFKSSPSTVFHPLLFQVHC